MNFPKFSYNFGSSFPKFYNMNLLKYNPHWQEGFFYDFPKHRELFSQIKSLIPARQIIALTGLRRTGKSVLLLQTINHLIKQGTDRLDILYFTFDYERPTIETLLAEYQLQTGKKADRNRKIFVFFDEIQKLPDFQEQIKLYFDLFPNIKFFISGSTSLFIKKRIRESLAGRIFNLSLKPLNFKEYLYFTDQLHLLEQSKIYFTDLELEFKRFLKKQFIETITFDERQTELYLSSILDKIVYEDIPSIYKVENPQIVKQILHLLAQFPGMLVNYTEIAKELKISNKTVSLYFDILKEAFLIQVLKNFSKNLSTSDRKNKRAYISSVSFSLFLNKSLSDGLAAENYVASQTSALYFWRDSYKHEVDFISLDNHQIIAKEVKFKTEIQPADVKNLILFSNKFNTDSLQIIAKVAENHSFNYKGKTINIKPIWYV